MEVFSKGRARNSARSEGSALREVLGAQSGVQRRAGREIKGVAKDKAFGVGLTDYGEEDSGLANFFAGGSGGVGQPD